MLLDAVVLEVLYLGTCNLRRKQQGMKGELRTVGRSVRRLLNSLGERQREVKKGEAIG